MKTLTKFGIYLLLILVLVGCETLQELTFLEGGISESTPEVEPTLEVEVPDPQVEQTATPPGQTVLILWLPPEFDPQADTPAGELIKNRLADFEYNQPGVKVETRLKAPDGSAGLLESLRTASSAAPLAVPDLIALTTGDMREAALSGLITPVPGFEQILAEEDWFGFARDSASFQDQIFSLPFASNVMLQMYRNDVLESAPADWNTVLTSSFPLVFPAADPSAAFTLIQYLASGGAIQDENGNPWLDADILTDVLTFYQEAEKQGVMPYWLTQYETEDQVWGALQEQRANTAAVWTRTGPWNSDETLWLAALPTQNGTPYSLAQSWVWAAPSNQNDRLELTTRLANHLSDPAFLAQWNQVSGQLPVRQTVLDQFSDTGMIAILQSVLQSSSVPPGQDILSALSPALEKATVDVLKRQDEPESAAQTALNALTGP
jgi:ABC-type glycerol-3-phosphate transport system substrate-binding protein